MLNFVGFVVFSFSWVLNYKKKGRKPTIRSEIKLTTGFNMKLQNYNQLITWSTHNLHTWFEFKNIVLSMYNLWFFNTLFNSYQIDPNCNASLDYIFQNQHLNPTC